MAMSKEKMRAKRELMSMQVRQGEDRDKIQALKTNIVTRQAQMKAKRAQISKMR